MRAKKAEITRYSAENIEADPACIGLPGSPTKVVSVFPPVSRGERTLLKGTLDEQIDQLVDKLLPYM
jgi:electron transfer flavoprotein beta subunit